MAIPKKWSYIEGELCETLPVEQFSTDFDICYDVLSPIIGFGSKLCFKKNIENRSNLALMSRLALHY